MLSYHTQCHRAVHLILTLLAEVDIDCNPQIMLNPPSLPFDTSIAFIVELERREGIGGGRHLFRASVVKDTTTKTTRGISGISLAMRGDKILTKKASPRMATNRAESKKPRNGYAMYLLKLVSLS